MLRYASSSIFANIRRSAFGFQRERKTSSTDSQMRTMQATHMTEHPQIRIYSILEKLPYYGAQSPARSSCESEYRALAKCMCEAIWLRRLINKLGFGINQPTYIGCDNQSNIKIAKDPMFHDKTKHFEVDWHFTRQMIEDRIIKVEFVPTSEQPADILNQSPR